MGDIYSVEMTNIHKSFGGVYALKSASLKVKPGEVHAIIGENGAGKSTLIKILSGALKSDQGTIKINGGVVTINNTHDAIKKGISVIYQEMNLVGHLSVAENLFLGEQISLKKPIVRWKELYANCREVLNEINYEIDPKAIVSELSIAYQQMLEVAKALSHASDIIVFDEPTAVLTSTETERLFEVIENLRKQNKSIIYISHRMNEIFRISDRVTVMKNGETMGTYETDKMTEQYIVELMIGRKLADLFPPKAERNNMGETILEVKNIFSGPKVQGVSFSMRRGEILGFAGLVGAGKTEVMRSIFGADKIQSGELIVKGVKVKKNSPKMAKKKGIAYISENRKEEGIILDMAIRDNITLADIHAYTLGGWLNTQKEKVKVGELAKSLSIKTENTMNPASSLSGGNQQKVSLAKWMARENDIMLFDEPTRGVDVGSKAEIYNIIAEVAASGCAVIIVSSEMMEIIGMCNRVIIMHEGKITGELFDSDITEENILSYALALR